MERVATAVLPSSAIKGTVPADSGASNKPAAMSYQQVEPVRKKGLSVRAHRDQALVRAALAGQGV